LAGFEVATYGRFSGGRRGIIKMESGEEHDEIHWTEVAKHACQVLSAKRKIVLVTAGDHDLSRDSIDHAVAEGYQIVTVPQNIRQAITGLDDIKGSPVRDLAVFNQEWADSFQFQFIAPERLTKSERAVFVRVEELIRIAGGLPKNVSEIKISETMRPDLQMGDNAVGLWEPANGRIIIKRSQLTELSLLAGTLLHEITHAATGHPDVSRAFESALTELLGNVAATLAQVH
jgi:hypothetical protein